MFGQAIFPYRSTSFGLDVESLSRRIVGTVSEYGGEDVSGFLTDIENQVKDLEDKYGDAARTAGRAVFDAYNAGKTLADSGASNEDIINSVAAIVASAAGIISLIPGVGWIAGAVGAISAAIVALLNYLTTKYGPRVMDTREAGINFALIELGYSERSLTGDWYFADLDTDALAKASLDGWVFFVGTHHQDSMGMQRDNFYMMERLAAKILYKGEDFGRCWRALTPTGTNPVDIRECKAYMDGMPLGPFRFNYIFGTGLTGAPPPVIIRSGMTVPSSSSTEHVGSGSISRTQEDYLRSGVYANIFRINHGGERHEWYTYAFILNKMPPGMARSVRAGLMAPREEWPDDLGVKAVLEQIREGDGSEDSPRANLLTYAMGWAADEEAKEKSAKSSAVVPVVAGVGVAAALAYLVLAPK